MRFVPHDPRDEVAEQRGLPVAADVSDGLPVTGARHGDEQPLAPVLPVPWAQPPIDADTELLAQPRQRVAELVAEAVLDLPGHGADDLVRNDRIRRAPRQRVYGLANN